MKNDIFLVVAVLAAFVLAGRAQQASVEWEDEVAEAFTVELENDPAFQALLASVNVNNEQYTSSGKTSYLTPIEFESSPRTPTSFPTTEPTTSPPTLQPTSFIPDKQEKTYPSILEAIGDHPKLIRLTMLLLSPNLADVRAILSSYMGPLTLFAPSDAALARAQLDGLPNDEVKATLLYHIAGRALMTKDIRPSQIVDTLLTHPTMVLMGSDMEGEAVPQRFKLVKRGGIVEVVSGEKQAWVMGGDIKCENGVLHIIDDIIPLPKTVVDTATASYLSSFVKLIERARMEEDVLNETPDITFFIPTDQAPFELTPPKAIAEEEAMGYLNPAMLARVLRNHMVPGVRYGVELTDGMILSTFTARQGLKVERGDGFFRVGGANVLWADIPVQNGVVHVVDKVLVGEAEGPW